MVGSPEVVEDAPGSPQTPDNDNLDELYKLYGLLSDDDSPSTPLDFILRRNHEIRKDLQTHLQPSVAARKRSLKKNCARVQQGTSGARSSRLSVRRPKYGPGPF